MKSKDIQIGKWYSIYASPQMAREGGYDRIDSHNTDDSAYRVLARVTQRKWLCEDTCGNLYHMPLSDFAYEMDADKYEFDQLRALFDASASQEVQ